MWDHYLLLYIFHSNHCMSSLEFFGRIWVNNLQLPEKLILLWQYCFNESWSHLTLMVVLFYNFTTCYSSVKFFFFSNSENVLFFTPALNSDKSLTIVSNFSIHVFLNALIAVRFLCSVFVCKLIEEKVSWMCTRYPFSTTGLTAAQW